MTTGTTLDNFQKNYGPFGWANLLPHLKSFSREEINSVLVEDCGEILVRIHETDKIIFLNDWPAKNCPLLRKRVWEMLKEASLLLPDGVGFGLLECYRPIERQMFLRTSRFELVKKQNPEMSDEQIWKIVDVFVSRPGGPHQTGGAIDLTLVDLKTGKPFDMGTEKQEINKFAYTASNLVSPEAQVHRFILCTVMTYVGFRNYPAEWWHYEYGTRRHSKYLMFEKCFYGPLENIKVA